MLTSKRNLGNLKDLGESLHVRAGGHLAQPLPFTEEETEVGEQKSPEVTQQGGASPLAVPKEGPLSPVPPGQRN